jgi:class 3 adenylate cyclase
MSPRVYRWLYRRLGHRYVRIGLVGQLAMSYVVVGLGVAGLFLYVDMSAVDWLWLWLVADVLLTIENVVAYRIASNMLRPADPWLRGDRRPATAAAAWRALTAMPGEYTRRLKAFPILFNAVPFCAFATWRLDLPWYSFFFLLAGGIVLIAAGLYLRYFTLDLALKPVVEDAARDAPPDVQARGGVTLRYRLLIGLPVLNVITGLLVAGLSQPGSGRIEELGLDVLVAVVVAFTVAFELALLLTRSVLAPIASLQRATSRVAEGDLRVRVPVTGDDELGTLARSFNEMVGGLEQRERLREAFGAFVDPALAERVAKEGTMISGQEVEVTVLFVDIRDFTALAERTSAPELVERLNAFYSLVVPVIVRHGGHANKFVGDGLLAVFGALAPQTDHADRAMAAALEIAGAVRERYGEELRIGVGLNSGPVVAGTIGGGGRVDFTVIGDAVNTAARVEEATRATGDEILLTEATRCLLTRDFGGFEPRDEIPLKGKSDPVRLCAPLVTARHRRTVAAPLTAE